MVAGSPAVEQFGQLREAFVDGYRHADTDTDTDTVTDAFAGVSA
jgi:hypothetical protein